MWEIGIKMDTTYALPQVDETRCTLCELCVEACPCQAVKLGEQGPIFTCPEACPCDCTGAETLECSCLCEEVCPTDAIACAFEIVFEAGQGREAISAESHRNRAAGG